MRAKTETTRGTRVSRALAALLTGTALVLGGCAALGTPAEPDCDRGDQREHDRDCGYWDARTGRFVLWYWVRPGHDSVPPAGWVPHVPRGGSYVAPPNARPGRPGVQPSPAPAPRVATPGRATPRGGSTGGPAGGGVRVPPAPPRAPAPPPRPNR